MREKLTIERGSFRGKRVLCRFDWNVPLTAEGGVASDARIRATLPTIRMLLEQGCALVCMSHLGRPKGTKVASLTMRPVADRVSALLEGTPVRFIESCRGPEALQAALGLRAGEVLVLENLRFEPGETENDDGLAAELSTLAEAYVNDAFAVCHREHASVVGVPKILTAAAGLLVAREMAAIWPLTAIDRQSACPPRPFVALVGGAKVRDKVGLLEALIPKLDAVLVGGAMAYTFLLAKGAAVGLSRTEPDKVEVARSLLELAVEAGTEVVLPSDHVVAPALDAGADGMQVVSEIPDDQMGLDIGPETATRFLGQLQRAQTVVWNGPMGVFENPPFDGGTRVMAQTLARLAGSGRTVVAGGGETESAAERFGAASALTHISTGGGAFLQLLEGRELPGLAALRDAEV